METSPSDSDMSPVLDVLTLEFSASTILDMAKKAERSLEERATEINKIIADPTATSEQITAATARLEELTLFRDTVLTPLFGTAEKHLDLSES